jgi:hypothetical protein
MVELIPDPRQLSLAMREAEISVQLTRPGQHDLILRRIGSLAFGLYASPGYLQQRDEPDFEGGCPGQHLITQLDDLQDSMQTGWLADLAPRARPCKSAVTKPLSGLVFIAAAWPVWLGFAQMGRKASLA